MGAVAETGWALAASTHNACLEMFSCLSGPSPTAISSESLGSHSLLRGWVQPPSLGPPLWKVFKINTGVLKGLACVWGLGLGQGWSPDDLGLVRHPAQVGVIDKAVCRQE